MPAASRLFNAPLQQHAYQLYFQRYYAFTLRMHRICVAHTDKGVGGDTDLACDHSVFAGVLAFFLPQPPLPPQSWTDLFPTHLKAHRNHPHGSHGESLRVCPPVWVAVDTRQQGDPGDLAAPALRILASFLRHPLTARGQGAR
jgi:hypothetical protein